MILEKRIPLSYWIKIIRWDMLFVAIFSSIAHFVSFYLPNLNIPASIAAFLGTAIALLLSFKLSQSYDRWWEARKIWGAIVNDSRTLVLQIKSFSTPPEHDLIRKIGFRQIAWCYSLGQRLRKQNSIEHIGSFIDESELASITSYTNIPLALIDMHTKDLNTMHTEKYINDFQQIQIDTTLLRLCESMGKAERIKNTEFPKTYRKTLHFFIYIFLITLSFSLIDIYPFVEIPLLMFISLPFFLLQKIAHSIQDPFEGRPTDTAMTTISKNIEIDIKQMLNVENIPKPLQPDTFYIL